MKNPRQERLYRLMRQYYRHDQWQLRKGLYLPHSYEEPRKLSWWDDVGFILNGRHVMAWWVHPRMSYVDAIEELAWKATDTTPSEFTQLLSREPSQKIWKKVGRSRKKVVGYQASPWPEGRQAHYDKMFADENRLRLEGIDFEVRPSMTVKAFSWCRGVELCVPVEVRNEKDAEVLADLARRLIKGATTLDTEFPGYRYDRKQWLDEAVLRDS